jgi:hypothetical protein
MGSSVAKQPRSAKRCELWTRPREIARTLRHLPYELAGGAFATRLLPVSGTDQKSPDPAAAEKNETPRSAGNQGVSVGRPDWFRTNDLFRVKEALYR